MEFCSLVSVWIHWLKHQIHNTLALWELLNILKFSVCRTLILFMVWPMHRLWGRKRFQKPHLVLADSPALSKGQICPTFLFCNPSLNNNILFFRLVQYCLSLNFMKMSSETGSSMISHIYSGTMHQIWSWVLEIPLKSQIFNASIFWILWSFVGPTSLVVCVEAGNEGDDQGCNVTSNHLRFWKSLHNIKESWFTWSLIDYAWCQACDTTGLYLTD